MLEVPTGMRGFKPRLRETCSTDARLQTAPKDLFCVHPTYIVTLSCAVLQVTFRSDTSDSRVPLSNAGFRRN